MKSYFFIFKYLIPLCNKIAHEWKVPVLTSRFLCCAFRFISECGRERFYFISTGRKQAASTGAYYSCYLPSGANFVELALGMCARCCHAGVGNVLNKDVVLCWLPKSCQCYAVGVSSCRLHGFEPGAWYLQFTWNSWNCLSLTVGGFFLGNERLRLGSILSAAGNCQLRRLFKEHLRLSSIHMIDMK